MLYLYWFENGKLRALSISSESLALLLLITGLTIDLIIKIIKLGIKKRRQRIKERIKVLPPKRAGADSVLKCIDKQQVYELVDDRLKLVLFQHFKNALASFKVLNKHFFVLENS